MEKRTLKSSRPARIRTESDLFNFTQTWKTVCKDGLFCYSTIEKRNDVDACNLQDIQLHVLEQALVEALKAASHDDFLDYIYQDNLFTNSILLSNAYMGDPNEEKKILLALEQRFSILRKHSSCNELLQELLKLYREYGFISKIYQPEQIDERKIHLMPDVDRAMFCRYLLSRQLDFFNAVETEILNNNWIFNDPRKQEVLTIVENKSALQLQYLIDLLEKPLEQSAAPVEPSELPVVFLQSEPPSELLGFAPMSAMDDYQAYEDKIKTINKELSGFAKKMSPNANKETIDVYYKKYDELSRIREVNTYILSQKKKELSYIQQAKVSSKDFLKKNWADKKGAAKEFGKVLAVKAGTRLAKASWNIIKGKNDKNDWNKIGEELAWDLGEATLAGISTLILGPVGGKLAGTCMAFFRPQPVVEDPYKKEFDQLNDKLDQGFNKLSTKIDDLSVKLNTQFESWSKYIVDKVKLDSKITTLQNKIAEVRSNITSIKRLNIEMRTQNAFDVKSVIDLDKKIRDGIEHILQLFYNENYLFIIQSDDGTILRKQEQYPVADSKSIYNQIVKLYSEKNQSFVPFLKTCDELFGVCDLIQEVVEVYFGSRAKYMETLAGAMLFHKVDITIDKADIFWKIHDNIRDKYELQGELFSIVYELKKVLVGENNFQLYQNMNTYWYRPEKFLFLNGFGLTDPTALADKPAQYRFELDENYFWGKGKFVSQQVTPTAHIYRYYIAPPPPDKTIDTYTTYNLITYQKSETPITTSFKVALGFSDTLVLTKADFSDEVKVRVVPLSSDVYQGSFEKFLLDGVAFPPDLDRLKWSLPAPGFSIKIGAYDPHRSCYGEFLHSIIQLIDEARPEATSLYFLNNANGQPLVFQPSVKDGSFKLQLEENGPLPAAFISSSEEDVKGHTNTDPSTFIQTYDKANGLAVRHLFANVNKENLSTIDNLRIAKYKNRLRTGDVLKPGSTLESDNGKYTLKFDTHYIYDSILNLYEGDHIIGSVFKEYTYNNNYSVHAELQLKDGHFILFDEKGHVIAATGIYKDTEYSNASLLLTNSGKLLLIKEDGALIKEIVPTKDWRLHYRKDGHHYMKNRLMTNHELRPDEYITSANGAYAMKVVLETTNWSWFNGQKKCRLIYYRQPDGKVHEVLHGNDEFDPANWKHKVIMQEDGNLVMLTINDALRDSVRAIAASATENNQGAFLVLEDDGSIVIRSADGSRVIKKLN